MRLVAQLVAALALLIAPEAARATVTQSRVIAPADQSYITDDRDAPSTVTVTGTSDGTSGDTVDLLCYYGATQRPFATGVPVAADGSFTTDLQSETIAADKWCVIRAVPSGTTPDAPPGSGTPFAGPTVYPGQHKTMGADWFVSRTQPGGYFEYQSSGSCGIGLSAVFDGSGAPSSPLFWCNGGMPLASKRSEIKIGLALPQGYVPDFGELPPQQYDAYNHLSAYLLPTVSDQPAGSIPGVPPMTVTHSVDPATGDTTITESEDIVVCSPGTLRFPPLADECRSFVPSGVTFKRVITQTHQGHQTTVDDYWTSVDGQDHTLGLEMPNWIFSATSDAQYRMPWISPDYDIAATTGRVPGPELRPFVPSPGIPDPNTGEVKPGPPQPNLTPGFPPQSTLIPNPEPIKPNSGTIYIRGSRSAPDGDPRRPYGAITFGSPISGVNFSKVAYDAPWTRHDELVLGFPSRTILAGQTIGVSVTYSQSYSQEEVNRLAAEAEARFQPRMAMDSAVEGRTSALAGVTLTGTSSDPTGIVDVAFGRRVGTINPDGRWAIDVNLTPGTNRVAPVLTNFWGTQITKPLTINYVPPTVAPLVLTDRLKVRRRTISVRIQCISSGRRCTGRLTLTTKAKRARDRKLIGSVRYAIPSDGMRTVVLRLNRLGGKLVTRKRRVKATFKLLNDRPGRRPEVVLNQNVVMRR
jgi:hypothetical protein